MVLGEGKIVGMDSLKTLLKNKLTFFYQLYHNVNFES